MVPFLAALAPFAPLIGGAIAGIGALFQPKPEPQVVTNEVDLGKLRKSAQDNGFNPLTVIRNGGMAGFTTTRHPNLSWNPIGDALTAFGTGVMNFSYNPKREALENTLLEKQIKSYDLPKSGYRTSVSASPTRSTSGGSWNTAATKPRFFGVDWLEDTNFSSAQINEDRYGDFVDSVGGVVILGADTMKTGEADFIKSGGAKAMKDFFRSYQSVSDFVVRPFGIGFNRDQNMKEFDAGWTKRRKEMSLTGDGL